MQTSSETARQAYCYARVLMNKHNSFLVAHASTEKNEIRRVMQHVSKTFSLSHAS